MSSLRRSARARVPASDSDGATQPERRKRKRSTMTPETSQSPAKGSSPDSEGVLPNGTAEHSSSPLANHTSTTRPLARKIIVKTSRRSQGDQNTSLGPAPTSNGIVEADTEEDASQQELQDVHLSKDDKQKLKTVIEAYAPGIFSQKIATQIHEKPASIEQYLSQPECSIRALRNHIIALRRPLISPTALRPHLSSSYISPPIQDAEEDRRKLSILTMLLAVVDEIGIRNRIAIKTEKKERAPVKSTNVSDEDDYALSMRLPSGDYFTNAIRLSTKDALHLDPGNSKLISVATQPISLDTRTPPTLKERLPKYKPAATTSDSNNDNDDLVKPVSHLYYNPWSSFAPTYDSFDGTLSISASCALWRAKRDDREILEDLAEEPISAREELEDLLEDMNDIDAKSILATYDDLKEEPDLTRNGLLLQRLDQLQSQRWKRAFAKRTLKQEDFTDEPSKEEREIASEIVDTLSQLLSKHSRTLAEVLPSSSALRAAASSAIIDPALLDGKGEAGYWGSLNENLYGPTATRRVPGAKSTPIRPMPALRDNETIKMEPANDEKVIAQSSIASKGKGLLERFAEGRQYKLEDHPHDRKLVAPATNTQASSMPGSTSQQQTKPPPAPSHPSQPRHQMSPPSSNPPSRPYHQSPMRPSPSPSYSGQKQGSGYFNPSPANQQPNSQRTWSQQASPYYPARPSPSQ